MYFDSSHDTEDAARRIDLRWRAIHDQLSAAGDAAETLAALDTAAEGIPSRGRAGRALVAADDTVLVDEHLPEPPPVRIVRVSQLPYLLPLIEHGARHVAHVVVADRTGADLRAVDERGVDQAQHSVRGREHPVHKVRGWRLGARVLVLAGEVQARSALGDALTPRAQAIAPEVEAGSRAAGSDPNSLDLQVRRVVEVNAEGLRQAVLEQFRTERGRTGGLAVQGLSETTSELNAAAAEYLLVNGSALADRMVWTGREPTQLAMTEEELRATGVHSACECRLWTVSLTPLVRGRGGPSMRTSRR